MDNRTLEEVRNNETKLIKEIMELEQQLKKKDEVIEKAIECINNSIFGYSDWECQKPLYLKDDDVVGKELLSILEDKEVE